MVGKSSIWAVEMLNADVQIAWTWGRFFSPETVHHREMARADGAGLVP